ncbi:MAG TPA: divalent-cation tolerance protein CutA [Burkholderiaceae bacterium]
MSAAGAHWRWQREPARDDEVVVVISNAPDEQTALRIARALVEEGLAACVNVLPPCHSIYRWQGEVEQAQEFALLAKTVAAKAAQLGARLAELHPYEVPEAIAVPVTSGLQAYLDWVVASTKGR